MEVRNLKIGIWRGECKIEVGIVDWGMGIGIRNSGEEIIVNATRVPPRPIGGSEGRRKAYRVVFWEALERLWGVLGNLFGALGRLLGAYGRLVGPKWPPRWPQEAAKWTQEAARRPPEGR